MAGRFGRSFYGFSSVNRPTAPTPRYPSMEPRPRSPPTQPRPASPPSSPPYRPPPPSSRLIASPPKPVHKYPKSPEPKQKPMVHKGVQKAQQPNAINIAGENVGAVMEIVESSKGEGGHVIKKKETPRGVVGNIDDTVNDQDKAGAQKAPTSSSLPATTFLNTNFQSLNNSLLFDASLAHRDPGLHLAFSRNRTGDRTTVDDKKQHHAKH